MDHSIIACHDCDLIHHLPPVYPGQVARCTRCHAVLIRPRKNSIERTLALAITGLILFIIANSYPFLSFALETETRETTMLSGVVSLFIQKQLFVAVLVFLTIFLIPLAQLLGLIYIYLPVYLGKPAKYMPLAFRVVRKCLPWSMMEVFMLAILVSIVKLAKMAQIIPGVSLYALLALIFILAAMTSGMDPHALWERWEQPQ